jgi:hypothetical protein
VHATQVGAAADQAEAVLVRQAEVNYQHVMRTLKGHALSRPGIPRRFYMISGISQRTPQEALNSDFVLHQQQPHDLMLTRQSTFPRTPGGRLVTVAVVVDVTGCLACTFGLS